MVSTQKSELPLIDIGPLVSGDNPESRRGVAMQIDMACRTFGFFRIQGHGVPLELQQRLDSLSREFFDLPTDEKRKVALELGGTTLRGWFPLRGELTSGKPDQKEGLYLG